MHIILLRKYILNLYQKIISNNTLSVNQKKKLMYKLEELNNKRVADLKKIGEELSIPKFEKLKKQELIYAILDHQAENSKMKPENSKMKPENSKNEKKDQKT